MKLKRWMIKAMSLIDNIFEMKGPQTLDYIYAKLMEKAVTERKYKEISRSMSERKLMWLLMGNYRETGMVASPKNGNLVVLWGPN